MEVSLMLNLMRLEIKKYHLGSYVKRATFANFVILGVMFMLLFITKIGKKIQSLLRNYQTALTFID